MHLAQCNIKAEESKYEGYEPFIFLIDISSLSFNGSYPSYLLSSALILHRCTWHNAMAANSISNAVDNEMCCFMACPITLSPPNPNKTFCCAVAGSAVVHHESAGPSVGHRMVQSTSSAVGVQEHRFTPSPSTGVRQSCSFQ